MDPDDFDEIQWRNGTGSDGGSRPSNAGQNGEQQSTPKQHSSQKGSADTTVSQIGRGGDALDLAGVEDGVLQCQVDCPQKENDGTKDVFVSYQVTTHTDFKSFQKPTSKVRRRFTDFVFLQKTLIREYPECAVPPLPDKHKMEYVRGDRFGPDFTSRRAHSLHRFLTRLTLHPRLRRSAILIIFLESNDWNAQMASRPQRVGSPSSEQSGGVFDNFTDTFLNAFSKVHKPDKRFLEVRENLDKLEEDLSHVEKVISRIARRGADLEGDYTELETQFRKLINLEPGIETPIEAFSSTVEATAGGLKTLKEHVDQNYLGSLRDMTAYVATARALLKLRDQKQLDFEALTEYLTKAATERDLLASSHGSSGLTGPGGFLRSKIEDVRGVDHEQARRERVRKLELRINVLTGEVEAAKTTSEMFDEEVVHEVADFGRIKTSEFKDTLGGLADAHIDFYSGQVSIWDKYLKDMEKEGVPAA